MTLSASAAPPSYRACRWLLVPFLSCLELACGGIAESSSTEEQPLGGNTLRYDDSGMPVLGVAAPDNETLPDGTVRVSETPLTLLIVFDSSGSMATRWDSRSRWQAAYDSVVSAVAAFQDNLTVGAVIFPTDESCGAAPIWDDTQIDFRPGGAFLEEWPRKALGPLGGTPLYLSLAHADEAIARATEFGLLDHRFRVLVFSDGEPTCADDMDAIRHYPARWLEHGIHTYVLSLPGSLGAAHLLDDIADAGGTGAAFGGGPAIQVDTTATEIYNEGVEQEGADRVVVNNEEDLDDITHAAAR